MAATNEPGLTNFEDLKKSEEFKTLIHQEVLAATAKFEDQRLSLQEKDPFNVWQIMPRDAKGEFVPTAEKRDYQKCIDMTHRINEWLHTNGTFRDAAGKTVRMGFADAVHSKDMHMLFPKVVSSIVLTHAEPMSNILSLYEKVRFTSGTQVTFPIWSDTGSSINLLMPEVGEPNELTGDLSSFITATTGKVGIKASMSEDAMRFSIIDLYALQLKGCGRALGKFKEKQAVENLFKAAAKNVLFDNLTPGSSEFGMTSGRNASGARNGTLASHDLLDAWAFANKEGNDIGTIIIHPLGWRALANNSVMRDRAYNNGGSVWNKPQGSFGAGSTGGSGINKIFAPDWTKKNVGVDEIATSSTQFAGIANVFGSPFRILTSPFAPIREGSNVAGEGKKYVVDLIVIDPASVGVHVIDQELYSREESKIFDQIKETAFFERYGFASSNKGSGLYMFKNIVATEGYDMEATPIWRQATLSNANDAGIALS